MLLSKWQPFCFGLNVWINATTPFQVLCLQISSRVTVPNLQIIKIITCKCIIRANGYLQWSYLKLSQEQHFNSLATGRIGTDLILEHMLQIEFINTSCEIKLM